MITEGMHINTNVYKDAMSLYTNTLVEILGRSYYVVCSTRIYNI